MNKAPDDIVEATKKGDSAVLAARLPELAGSVDDYGWSNKSLVVWAAIEGQTASLSQLVAAGSKPDRIPDILHTAIFSGWGQGEDVSIVAALLDAGCDVNQREKGEDGATPLYTAAMVAPFPQRSAASTKLLLERGADPNLAGSAQMRPLHVAVAGIASDTVRQLLAAGADTNATDIRGRTPAHRCVVCLGEAHGHAAGNEDDDSVEVAEQFISDNLQLLIEHGADVSLRDQNGRTPLQYIAGIQNCPEALVEMLLKAGSPASDGIALGDEEVDLLAMALVQDYSAEMAIRLYDAGCPVDQPYEFFGDLGWMEVSPQHAPHLALALCNHDAGFVDRLVSHRTKKGTNMLSCAAVGGNRELVDLLLSKGLSPSETNNEGKSAIDVAMATENNELAEYLRTRG